MKRHFTGDLWADAKLLQADERMTQARARAAATRAASTLAPADVAARESGWAPSCSRWVTGSSARRRRSAGPATTHGSLA